MQRKFEKYVLPYLFLLPAMTLVVVFGLYPIFRNIVISFQRWNFINVPRWVGFSNYTNLFDATLFPTVLKNTLLFCLLRIPPTIILALGLALLLNKKLFGKEVFRSLFFTPWVFPTVNIAILWMYILEPEYGLFNYVLGLFGIPGPGWFTSMSWALPAMAIISIWKSAGYFCVLYIGGLQNIPDELYGAAMIDGANSWKSFWHITLPQLTDHFVRNRDSDHRNLHRIRPASVLMLGPGNSTNLIVYYIYQRAFNASKPKCGSHIHRNISNSVDSPFCSCGCRRSTSIIDVGVR